MVSPEVIEKVVGKLDDSILKNDTVIEELKAIAAKQDVRSEDLPIAMAVYMLGFGSYKGFNK